MKRLSMILAIVSLTGSGTIATAAGTLTELMQSSRMTVLQIDHAAGRVLCAEHRAWTAVARADLGSVMGGVVLDLTGTQMEGDNAIVDVFTVMGGIEIFVPRDWNVTTKVVSFMGACVDKRRPATMPATKTLVVRGFAFLGGIDIKD